MKKHIHDIFGSTCGFWLDMLYDLLGAVLYSAGVMLFARTSGVALGGISGISLLINHFTGFPVGTGTLLLNLPLIFFSWRVLGRSFLVKSAISILIMTLVNDLLIAPLPDYSGDTFLAAVFCGALMGAGLGLVYSRGSSTGGTDFLVLPLRRLLPRFSLPQIFIAIDVAIILVGGLVYRRVDTVLYGIVASAVSTVAMDRLLSGSLREKMAVIITNDGMALAKEISDAIGRGATNLNATGTYTGEGKDVLLCVCSRHQVVLLRQVVHRTDPKALVMITEVTEAYGEGFQSPEQASL